MTQNTTEKKTYSTPKLAKLGDIGTITQEGGDWGGSRTWSGDNHNGGGGGGWSGGSRD